MDFAFYVRLHYTLSATPLSFFDHVKLKREDFNSGVYICVEYMKGVLLRKKKSTSLPKSNFNLKINIYKIVKYENKQHCALIK